MSALGTGYVETLRETPGKVSRLVRNLDPRAATWKPPGAEFSVLENVCHLRDIEAEGFTLRIERLMRENNPILPDLDGAKLAREREYNTRDLASELEGFRKARARSLALLERLGPATDAWNRTGTLETVGPITLEGLALRMVEHDSGHIEEIGRLVRGRRPLLLSGLLVLFVAFNLLGAVFGITHQDELLAQYPRLEGWLWKVYLSCPAIAIVSVVGMWRWRRWGFWLACAGGVLVLAIELYTQGFSPHVARVPISLALLAALVRPVWPRFR